MKISLLQMNLKFGDIDANFKKAEQMITEAVKTDSDVIMLPEMWNTSFFPKNVSDIADKNGEKSKTFLSSLAKKNRVNIVGGSVSVIKQNKLYNTSYSFDREGNIIAEYDKVHLFSPSGEDKVFESGNKLVTFELDGVKAGIVICYDIRFAEWVRMYALSGIQILFVPAAWPSIRIKHWRTLNRARAIENQMFVCSLNSVGSAGESKFGGNGSIIDPWGEYISDSGEVETIITGKVDLSVIKEIRSSINVFNDRKPEIYDIKK